MFVIILPNPKTGIRRLDDKHHKPSDLHTSFQFIIRVANNKTYILGILYLQYLISICPGCPQQSFGSVYFFCGSESSLKSEYGSGSSLFLYTDWSLNIFFYFYSSTVIKQWILKSSIPQLMQKVSIFVFVSPISYCSFVFFFQLLCFNPGSGFILRYILWYAYADFLNYVKINRYIEINV